MNNSTVDKQLSRKASRFINRHGTRFGTREWQRCFVTSSKDEPFVVAIVVRSEAPISGKPGDKAIIYPDGWIGGGCAQPLVIKEALRMLASGAPRLIRISPSPMKIRNTA